MTAYDERIQYLELRARTDCLLGIFRDGAIEFYGLDAERVASACDLPVLYRGQDVKGQPLAYFAFEASLSSHIEGNRQVWRLRFSAAWQEAINGAELPFAVACEWNREDEDPELYILGVWRPRLDRPTLRVV